MKEQSTLPDWHSLVYLNVPEQEPKEIGFLDIISSTSHENTISNLYAWFLDQEQSPELSTLLLDSLIELIEEKCGKENLREFLGMDDYDVQREVTTSTGRIDLVLKSRAGKGIIIIENKIYHHIANDLQEYWEHFNETASDYKIAILLSLDPMTDAQINCGHYTSITHSQWLNHACSKGVSRNLPVKQFIYFNDFVNNMNHLTKSKEMTPDVQFYFEHREKIEKAINAKSAAYNYILEQFRIVARNLNFTFHGNSDNWRELWQGESQPAIYYVIYPKEIIGGKVRVILQGHESTFQNSGKLKDVLRKHLAHQQLEELTDGPTHVQHLAALNLDIAPKDYGQLAELVEKEMNIVLEPIRKEMLELFE